MRATRYLLLTFENYLFIDILFSFIRIFLELILRSAFRHLGEKWTANKGTSDDLHSSEFLQFDGRHGPVFPANLCNSTTSELLFDVKHRQF